MLTRFILKTTAAAAALTFGAGMAVADYSLTILHTNDFHARFEPISKYDSGCSEEKNLEGKCFGGSARLVVDQKVAAETTGVDVIVGGTLTRIFPTPRIAPRGLTRLWLITPRLCRLMLMENSWVN